MEKFPIGTVFNNRYKIVATYKIEGGCIIYRAEDIRFIGSTWFLYQIDISENLNSHSYINNLFSVFSFLSKVIYDKVGKIVDYFLERGYLIVVCEELHGTLLSEIIYSSNPTVIKGIKLALQLLEIVKFLYEKNIINFIDLNPENIIVDKQGVVKIISFSIPKIPAIVTEKGVEENKYIGTFGYIPPEMLDDDKNTINQSSYIYIISAIIYEYFTKLSPYYREDPFFFPPPSSLSPIIPNQLSSLLEKCLSYNQNNRIKTFKEFEKKLQSILKYETEYEESIRPNLFLNILKNKAFFVIAIIIFIQLLFFVILLIYYFLFLL